MIYTETPVEAIALNFKLLTKALKVQVFQALEPEAQTQTLSEAIALMNNPQSDPKDVRRLATYLSALTIAAIDSTHKTRIAQSMRGWDFAPF